MLQIIVNFPFSVLKYSENVTFDHLVIPQDETRSTSTDSEYLEAHP